MSLITYLRTLNPPKMKKFLHLLFTLILVLSTMTVTTGQERNCQTNDNLALMMTFDPSIKAKMAAVERHTQTVIPKLQLQLRSEEKVIRIPVVVHVIYENQTENISEDLILSQIEVLNEDFGRYNADQTEEWGQAANTRFEFELAKFDPQGNPTNGIIRKKTSKRHFISNNEMKFDEYQGSTAWPSKHYLNLWVCDLYANKMGYAQFPGGGNASTDGVTIDYQFFGRTYKTRKYGLGRTTTHEVGHWLNLRHIWGDGDCNHDDFVEDTPSSSYPSFGCQDGKESCGSKDMVANFMDYSYDQCMNLFTKGQKDRMRALFQPGGFRHAILSSPALGEVEEEETPLEDNKEEESTPDEEEEETEEEDANQGNQDAEEEEEEEEEEIACAAPNNLFASIDGRYLNASWGGDPGDRFIFEIKLPNSTRWFGFELNKQQVSIAGLSSSLKYESRIKRICNNGAFSEYAYFNLSNSRVTSFSSSMAEIKAYPNPATNLLTVEWQPADFLLPNMEQSIDDLIRMSEQQDIPSLQVNMPSVSSIERIELYDRSGRLVISQRVNEGEYYKQLQVGHLNPGLFILVQLDSNGQVIAKEKITIIRR